MAQGPGSPTWTQQATDWPASEFAKLGRLCICHASNPGWSALGSISRRSPCSIFFQWLSWCLYCTPCISGWCPAPVGALALGLVEEWRRFWIEWNSCLKNTSACGLAGWRTCWWTLLICPLVCSASECASCLLWHYRSLQIAFRTTASDYHQCKQPGRRHLSIAPRACRLLQPCYRRRITFGTPLRIYQAP